MIPIVTDENRLREKSIDVDSLQEGLEISASLTGHTAFIRNGVGLSAPQIGILKRVAVVKVDREIILINPRVTDKDTSIVYLEGCLSFQGKSVKTTRYIRVTVEADYFVIDGEVSDSKMMVFGPNEFSNVNDPRLLESVAVQHEIDHLDGILIFDREAPKQKPLVAAQKIGRNTMVKVRNTSSGEVLQQKYKKVSRLVDSGQWVIVD